MNNRKFILPAFVLVVLVQLYVPAKMILDSEDILKSGVEYKFQTAPVDPYDPFRGKYITLQYKENTIRVPEDTNWKKGDWVYVTLMKDNDDYAKLLDVSKEAPNHTADYLKVRVNFIADNILYIHYPFDRFYMEESKALEAERIYRGSSRDQQQKSYALVMIRNGEAIIKDVMIDEVPIRELVKEALENKGE
ncbi:GDYXXLXY domain-containing protein [Rapidithrix thailandica]|uniref:GDYXXLXY domain-containing protein n=1 Tax=Rapidithrix thailandica TaxID=413964 RepID=A0AAW9SBX8_9BACT